MGGAEFTVNIEIERDKYFKQTTLEKLETNEVITEFLINMGYKNRGIKSTNTLPWLNQYRVKKGGHFNGHPFIF